MPDSPADLDLVGLTTDGDLWHTMRRGADGHWLPFEDSTIAEAGKPGDFIDVDCARQVANADQYPSALHVVGVTADGRLWWASRNSQTGSWSPFQNVEGSGGGEQGTFVRAAVSVSHAWPGTGTPHGQPTVEIHLAGLTSDGQLLVTSRTPTAATFSRFTNVELTSGNKAIFGPPAWRVSRAGTTPPARISAPSAAMGACCTRSGDPDQGSEHGRRFATLRLRARPGRAVTWSTSAAPTIFTWAPSPATGTSGIPPAIHLIPRDG